MTFRRRIVLGLALISAFGLVHGQERRLSLQGRSASSLLDRGDRLVIVYQNPGGGLGFATADPERRLTQVQGFVAASSAFSPVIKRDGSGEIGIVWEQHEGGSSEIHFGRLQANESLLSFPITRSTRPLYSPDLDFDGSSKPWITWIQDDGQRFFVHVACLGLNKSWIVNGTYTASALNPKILVGGRGEVWVFWTGRDKGRDEILACVLRGEAWTKPFKLNADDRYPHLSQSAALDTDGRPRVVWSAYDGRNYRIFTAAWDGERWSSEEKLTDGPCSDTSPAISFVFGTIPMIAWSRSSEGASSLCARFKDGAEWGPELKIVPDQKTPLRSPRIAVFGDRVGLTWESGETIGSLVAGFADLAGRTNVPPALAIIEGPAAAARDENQYTCFGDSITYAENIGYEPRLEPMLIQKYGSAKLWNEGEGGETTTDGLVRIDTAIAAHLSRYVLLMEGTNDVIFLDISMDTAAFDLEEMALKCQRAGMIPLLATIIPRKDWYWTTSPYQSRIIDLNGQIRRLAATLSFRLVDQYYVFINYPDSSGGWKSLLLDDGVHPNPTGFQLMAETWYAGIVAQKTARPPLNPSLSSRLDATGTRKINAVSWQANSGNAAIPLQSYRLYRKQADQGDASFAYLASVPISALQYEDGGLDVKTKYAYRLTALSQSNDESAPSTTVTETQKFEFPPLHPALATSLKRILFYLDKSNTISFEINPLNDDTTVTGYKIYRRKAEEDDTKFSWLATVGASTLSYKDLRLPVKQKYAYALTTIYADGRESAKSTVVTEK